jgi:hypothetical protein
VAQTGGTTVTRPRNKQGTYYEGASFQVSVTELPLRERLHSQSLLLPVSQRLLKESPFRFPQWSYVWRGMFISGASLYISIYPVKEEPCTLHKKVQNTINP